MTPSFSGKNIFLKIRGEECKTSKPPSVTVCATREPRAIPSLLAFHAHSHAYTLTCLAFFPTNFPKKERLLAVYLMSVFFPSADQRRRVTCPITDYNSILQKICLECDSGKHYSGWRRLWNLTKFFVVCFLLFWWLILNKTWQNTKGGYVCSYN